VIQGNVPGGKFTERIFLALVHYPVFNKEGETIASALTTVDIHDFSRIARTYQLGGVWIITPHQSQKDLFRRMYQHWTSGFGAAYNPTRKDALQMVSLADSIDDMTRKIGEMTGRSVQKIATTAKGMPQMIPAEEMVKIIRKSEDAFVILFGTGWGLAGSVLQTAEWLLTPIRFNEYNHLSVRSAASIICDRLIGEA